MAYTLTREALMLDLHAAYQTARRRKGGKGYVRTFEADLQGNLDRLADDLMERRYMPEPSSCFIVASPTKREVFAAQFRDRIVHHLYFDYTHELYERTFIADSYSCIEGRGTHYGIERLRRHVIAESGSYTKPCWVLKLDIRGYFMHIDRERLLSIALGSLHRMGTHNADGSRTWSDVIDMDFVEWLTREIVLLDPKRNCKMVGRKDDWQGLDYSKSMFNAPDGCGLPIGNLTSQLFSNVYMNVFDQYMKRELGCRHYGRYVDDAFVVSADRNWLLSLIPKVRAFLRRELGMELHNGKLTIGDVRKGVEYLGAFVKPYRIYVSRKSLFRTTESLRRMDVSDRERAWRQVNAFLGRLRHSDSFNIRANMFLTPRMLSVSTFDRGLTRLEKPY